MDLAVRAAAEWRDAPCYWLRGLPPRRWTAQHCLLPTQSEAQYVGCNPAQPQSLPSRVVLATDGSGGPFTSEPRLRRCGWAFVAMDEDGSIVAQGWGPLEGWRQTVPLSEREAATQLAASIQGDLQLFVDASYVVRGVRRAQRTATRATTTRGADSGRQSAEGQWWH